MNWHVLVDHSDAVADFTEKANKQTIEIRTQTVVSFIYFTFVGSHFLLYNAFPAARTGSSQDLAELPYR